MGDLYIIPWETFKDVHKFRVPDQRLFCTSGNLAAMLARLVYEGSSGFKRGVAVQLVILTCWWKMNVGGGVKRLKIYDCGL